MARSRADAEEFASLWDAFAHPQPEPDFADAAAQRLDDDARMREILARVGELPQLDQEVLALCVWQGLAPREAALAVGVPEATVRTRLHRARKRLRTDALPLEVPS